MITEAYQKFFEGLGANNNRDWFLANKKSYENDVKKPFLDLIETLLPSVKKLEPEVSMDPKSTLFRINRDVRFSKDKTPYNTLMKAGIAPGGKKSELPGFYLGMSCDEIYVGGGLFGVSTANIKNIRGHISKNYDEFEGIVSSKTFKTLFSELKGDRAKRIDKEHQPMIEKTAYILNKQFYTMAELPLKDHIASNKIESVILQHFNAIAPLNTFLKKAIS